MQGQNLGPPATFVTHHSKQTLPPYRVVVVFNAETYVSEYDMCRGVAKVPTAAQPGSLRMDMVFCIGDALKTHAAGYVQGLKGTGDPRFKKLVRGVTLALIPIQDAEDQGEPAIP